MTISDYWETHPSIPIYRRSTLMQVSEWNRFRLNPYISQLFRLIMNECEFIIFQSELMSQVHSEWFRTDRNKILIPFESV